MKKRFKILNTIFSFAFLLGMSGCSTNEQTERWKYTKEESSNFATFYANIQQTTDSAAKYVVSYGTALFTQKLSEDDILFFDYQKSIDELNSSESKDYLDYSIIKNNLVSYSSLETYENLYGFELTFDYDKSTKYAALIHKDNISHSEEDDAYFAIVLEYEDEEQKESEDEASQEEYERKYAESTFSWDKGGEFGFQIISNIGNIVAGYAFDSPVTTVAGIFSLLNTLGNGFLANGPTSRDIMNKLFEMDKKLDTILTKIDLNHNQLMVEQVRTQAKVDLVLLNQQKKTIADFNTNYVEKIDDTNRNMGVIYQNSYKELVKGSTTVDVYLYKNANDEWASRLLSECGKYSEDTLVRITIDSFPEAKNFLQQKSQIISDGFMDELYEDIDNAVSKISLPEDLEAEDFRYFVSSLIFEKFTKNYYSTHSLEAQDYANKIINMCKRYSGKSDDCISMTYLNRFKYMYNFGSELKKPMATFTAKHKYFLDTNVAKVVQACTFAGINYEEVVSEYKTARDTLSNWYKTTMSIPNNWSNILECKLNGTFYQTEWVQSYDNLGSHAILNARLNTNRYVPYPGGGWTPEYVHLNERAFISDIEHLRLLTRFKLLKELGYVKSDRTYLYYLVDGGVMPAETVKIRDDLVAAKKINPNCNRFFTSYNLRTLTDSDAGMEFSCAKGGNPNGDFFKCGCEYKFKQAHGSEYWHGEQVETTWIDADTGSTLSDKRVAARAWYEEHHGYWRNDELWCFSHYKQGSTNFFGLEKA